MGQVAHILQELVKAGKTNISLQTAYDALDVFNSLRNQWLCCRGLTADAAISFDIFKGEGETEPLRRWS
jgi:hypothetical protein